jgi:hypothetical protein
MRSNPLFARWEEEVRPMRSNPLSPSWGRGLG